MSINTLNEKAQERFESLRKKMKLDIGTIAKTKLVEKVIEDEKESITPEEFDALQNHPQMRKSSEKVQTAIDNFVEESFAFIESLKLSPNLSMAIGLIISAGKTNDSTDLEKAIKAIQEEINDR